MSREKAEKFGWIKITEIDHAGYTSGKAYKITEIDNFSTTFRLFRDNGSNGRIGFRQEKRDFIFVTEKKALEINEQFK